jgi:hypothetical protein
MRSVAWRTAASGEKSQGTASTGDDVEQLAGNEDDLPDCLAVGVFPDFGASEVCGLDTFGR